MSNHKTIVIDTILDKTANRKALSQIGIDSSEVTPSISILMARRMAEETIQLIGQIDSESKAIIQNALNDTSQYSEFVAELKRGRA